MLKFIYYLSILVAVKNKKRGAVKVVKGKSKVQFDHFSKNGCKVDEFFWRDVKLIQILMKA